MKTDKTYPYKCIRFCLVAAVFALSFFAFSSHAFADIRIEHFVALNGAGSADGSSWANAWSLTNFNTSSNWGSGETKISAGETVYFDGGTSGVSYTQAMPQGSGTSGNHITFRPGAAHPTLSAGHNGLVTFNGGAPSGIENGTNTYLTWDGEWSGSDSNALIGGLPANTFKFKVTSTTSTGVHFKGSYNRFLYMDVGDNGDTEDTDHAFQCNPSPGLEPTGTEIAYCYIHNAAGDGINIGRTLSQAVTDIHIHHNHFYHNAVDGLQLGGGLTFDHNYVDLTGTVVGTHGDGIQAADVGYLDIYANVFYNCPQSLFLEIRDTDVVEHIWIYNNIFRPGDYSYTAAVMLKPWRYQTTGNMTLDSILIANNTFDTLKQRAAIRLQDTTGAIMSVTNSLVANNIFYAIDYATAISADPGNYTDASYPYKNNAFYSNQVTEFDSIQYSTISAVVVAHPTFTGNVVGQPLFADYANHDYNLSASDTVAQDAGMNLSAYFTDDIIGTPRSSAWDIGAYEYGSGDTTPPSNPSGLSVS